MSCCCSKKEVVSTPNGPKAIGPYSVGVRAGRLVFTAGQVGFIPGIGKLAPGGIEAETRQTLLNMQAILEAAGSSLENVVKTTVFMRDINEFSAMNAVYAEFFKVDPPARSTFQVAALPGGAAIEIESVALLTHDDDCDCDCDDKEG